MGSENRPSDEHENWWSRELASMSPDPGDMEDSIYAEPLPDMDDYRKEVGEREQDEDDEQEPAAVER